MGGDDGEIRPAEIGLLWAMPNSELLISLTVVYIFK
jgi:hypothetical protein